MTSPYEIKLRASEIFHVKRQPGTIRVATGGFGLRGLAGADGADSGMLKTTETTAWIEAHGVPKSVTLDNDDRVEKFISTDGKTYSYARNRPALIGLGDRDFDVIIYGGTQSAMMAARKVKAAGGRVAMIDPWPRLGGAVISGGLIVTDFPSPSSTWYIMQGQTRQFYQNIISRYDDPDGTRTGIDASSQMLRIFDPRAYQEEFNDWIADIDLVVSSSPIFAPSDLRKSKDGRIQSIRTVAGWLNATAFLDASYEGDLIRAAEAPFSIGRESQGTYGEPFAGYKPYGDGAYLLAGFETTPDGSLVQNEAQMVALGLDPSSDAGVADTRVQTLSVRLVITDDAGSTPFTAPDGYDKANYFVVGEGLALAEAASAGAADTLLEAVANQGTVYLLDGADARQTNNGSSFIVSFERAQAGTDYANGNWTVRRRIVEEQIAWQRGLLYYLANDITDHFPSMSALKTNAAAFGYAPNLYLDSANGPSFPDWAYIRECLRLDGAYVCHQADMYESSSSNIPTGFETWHSSSGRTTTKSSRIARWSYFLDAHACRIFGVSAGGSPETFNYFFEGPTPVPHDTDVYDIPYSSLRTGRGSGFSEGGELATHVPNLLASVCISCSHVFWMSVRMEPAWSMIGEAAGYALVQMMDGTSSEDVDVSILQAALNKEGFRL
ncbi:hypothetical protein CSC94_05845 [Zhengella mangrovi]|uniref:Xanthan lyase n=1 Tax=Zhengella mangrovi TaxID=1982044 RepID=A0A2G1QRQ3_9HYPH|nr:FAD-dependent oxidoreductase [Zhengella mangrovi]PHP68172.1 hypothetical protein CSC94_05845 [Zhengella mangrovi]